MASSTPNSANIIKEVTTSQGSFIQIFADGTIKRPLQTPFEPPMLDDPQTGLSSKDIVISHNPTISARLYLSKITNSGEHDQANQVPIFVYFHGGGFLIESAFSKLYHGHFKTFVPQTNVLVVSVEYRLAPESPLPACYDDCWAALQWVSSQSIENLRNREPWLTSHGDFNKVFIGGDSAGGNIAHNIAMRAGTEALPGGVKILGAILTHPFFYSSYPIGSEHVIEAQHNITYKVWDLAYPSASGGIDNPKINPLASGAPSLVGLGCSRIIVCVAGNDRLRDRGVWYHEAVKKSGWHGKIELFGEKGEDHVYHLFKPESENANKLIKRLASFLLEE